MKKYLPFLLLFLGLGVLVLAFFLLKKTPANDNQQGSEEPVEIPLKDRPIVSLTPTSDGHYLTLGVSKIKITDVSTLNYELIYNVPNGAPQGVPGTVKLENKSSIEEKLLLGSESSGKFRYDEGVDKGTVTISFNNSAGKLVAKFSSDFSLGSNKEVLSTPDGKFSVTLDKVPKKEFFVLMGTVGIPDSTPATLASGPYGLFSSTDIKKLSGKVTIGDNKVFMHITGSRWDEYKAGSAFDSDTGIFFGTSE